MKDSFKGYMEDTHKHEGNLLKGLMWGVTMSIPLWVSFFGWIKLFGAWILHHQL